VEGGIDALICSGGTSSFNPMVNFRGDTLGKGLIEAPVGVRCPLND